jgi:ABC-type uncharacterized transport system permease subunit
LIPEIDASEILTSLMLVYVANLGMDYVVCGPGAIAGPATHRSSSESSKARRLIEQGNYHPAGSARL